jgi:hypothetical protein
MITKLEAGHRYRDSVLGVFIYLDEDEDGHLIYGPGSMGITGMQRHRLDLTTLVEVCYVDGEEMVVGELYRVRNHNNDKWNEGHLFVGVLKGLPFFRFAAGMTYHQWDHWEKAPVPTYHLVKSIDGQEVSRVEVSEEKAEELEGQ